MSTIDGLAWNRNKVAGRQKKLCNDDAISELSGAELIAGEAKQSESRSAHLLCLNGLGGRWGWWRCGGGCCGRLAAGRKVSETVSASQQWSCTGGLSCGLGSGRGLFGLSCRALTPRSVQARSKRWPLAISERGPRTRGLVRAGWGGRGNNGGFRAGFNLAFGPGWFGVEGKVGQCRDDLTHWNEREGLNYLTLDEVVLSRKTQK